MPLSQAETVPCPDVSNSRCRMPSVQDVPPVIAIDISIVPAPLPFIMPLPRFTYTQPVNQARTRVTQLISLMCTPFTPILFSPPSPSNVIPLPPACPLPQLTNIGLLPENIELALTDKARNLPHLSLSLSFAVIPRFATVHLHRAGHRPEGGEHQPEPQGAVGACHERALQLQGPGGPGPLHEGATAHSAGQRAGHHRGQQVATVTSASTGSRGPQLAAVLCCDSAYSIVEEQVLLLHNTGGRSHNLQISEGIYSGQPQPCPASALPLSRLRQACLGEVIGSL